MSYTAHLVWGSARVGEPAQLFLSVYDDDEPGLIVASGRLAVPQGAEHAGALLALAQAGYTLTGGWIGNRAEGWAGTVVKLAS